MSEEKPEVLLCANCDEVVDDVNDHVRTDFSWRCIEPDWKGRAKTAEAELTACYDEIFYTVPELMPLVEKIKAMRGMEADTLVRLANVQEELDKLKAKLKPRKQPEPKFEPIPDYGDHMTWDAFMECVKSGGFIDYDGSADLATATQCSDITVSPSRAKGKSFKKPEWCSHVVWYNK